MCDQKPLEWPSGLPNRLPMHGGRPCRGDMLGRGISACGSITGWGPTDGSTLMDRNRDGHMALRML